MNIYSKSQFAYILFDLDNTLYPKEAGLLDAMLERMTVFMIQKVGIPADDATIKRHEYHQRYGTTLRGLMAEYNIDPDDYLEFVHNVNLRDFFGPSPPLNRILEQIPLRKVIFTNADLAHSERVLNTLDVRQHFEQIIDVKTMNYDNKPHPVVYKNLLELLKVSGRRCIMVDDIPRNLFPAKNLGMTTILVGGENDITGIDFAIPTIFHIEQVLNNLLSPAIF